MQLSVFSLTESSYVSSVGSVTKLIGLLKSGDSAAAQKLWELFAARLLALARVSLASQAFHSLGVGDEDDVVVSALGSFFAGVEGGKFTGLTDREALWHLLCSITRRKASDLVGRENRQKRNPQAGQ